MYSASFQTLSAVSPPFPRSFPLRVSTVSSTVSTLYTLILIYHPFISLPSVIYLQLAAYRSLVSLFSFFLFFPLPLFPFLWKEYPLSSTLATPCACVLPPRASHPAFTCSPLPRIMATTLPRGIGGNGMKRRLVFGGCGIFGLRQIVSRFLFLLLCSPLLSFFGNFIYLWSFVFVLFLFLVFRLGRTRRWIRLWNE